MPYYAIIHHPTNYELRTTTTNYEAAKAKAKTENYIYGVKVKVKEQKRLEFGVWRLCEEEEATLTSYIADCSCHAQGITKHGLPQGITKPRHVRFFHFRFIAVCCIHTAVVTR